MKPRLIFIFLFCGIFLHLTRSGAQNINQPVPPDPDIRIGKLENGLTYYIKQNRKPEKRIELRLAVNAGSVCETDGQQGLAHFVEHMCFNGTKNFPSNRMVDMLEEMGVKFGAELNAYTSFDQTIYMLKVPADSIEWINRGFQVLEDWAHQVSLTDAEIDKERGVIVEEWRLGLGAQDRMQQKYIPVILKGSKYAERLPIGKVDIIKSFPYDTLRAFYNTWYRPDLIAVVAVGDIDPGLAETKIREHFANIPKPLNEKPRIEYPIPGNTDPLISIVTDKEATGYSAEIFFKHPKEKNITYGNYRDQLIKTLYTGMLNKRLREIQMKPDAPFIFAASGYGGFLGRSVDVYSLSLAAKENQIDKSIESVLTENERARRFGFTPTELDREKKELFTRYETMAKEAGKTESSSYADEYIRNYLENECIPGIPKEFEIVKNYLPGISLEEINKVGSTWTTDTDMAALLTAQEKEGVSVPNEQQVREIISSVRSKKIEAYVDKVTDVPLLREAPAGSKVIKRTDADKFGYTELVFGNGVHMILKPTDFKNDEILISAYSPGGSSLYPDSDIMSAFLAPQIVVQGGLGDYDFTGLQKKLSGNTAKIMPFIGELTEGVTGSCAPKDLETMLQLNYLYFTRIRRDENAYNAYMSRIRNMIKPLRSNPQVIFQDTLARIISMNSPREFALPSDAQLNQISLDRAISIYKDRFADASDFTYIMAGNFKTNDLIPILEKYIGGLPSIKRKETWKDVTPGFPKGLTYVEVPKNSEPQSQVAMVWKGNFKWNDADREEFSMLMDILAIKCRESMREDLSGTYGIRLDGSTDKLPKPKFSIEASWGCDPANIKKLTRTLLSEMDTMMLQGPGETDMGKVKETLIRERETRLKENNFWLAALQNTFMLGEKLYTLGEFKTYINSFTGKQIKQIANKYLDTRKYVEVALTPSANIEKK